MTHNNLLDGPLGSGAPADREMTRDGAKGNYAI